MSQIGQNNQAEENTVDDSNFEWGEFGQIRSKWSQNRAIIVSKPEVVEIETGQIAFITVEVLNQTKWPWKRGCHIGLLNKDKSEILVSDVPIEEEVKGM